MEIGLRTVPYFYMESDFCSNVWYGTGAEVGLSQRMKY